MKSCNEIRQAFLTFFRDRGHSVVPSSALVPGNDPTLLFTNAGMVQFKEVFLGTEKRSYQRAASSQRCVRAGGKHNDLDNVGYTARHHTFFEMLGNFSFGDYFKKEAIEYAWLFLTEELKLPKEKLWITVFHEDRESEAIWLDDIKVDLDRFSRCGEKDNFWSMGNTGPCGPCTEIFYDHGPDVAGGPPGTPEEDGDRYIEIWNLVFMQYDRAEDGTLKPLPKPSVDTGMGLERLAAVLQNVHSNYEIDLFQHLIQAAAKITDCKQHDNKSLRVIADHIRSCAFLIVDGVTPSNEGRGYVLRRIIRRAIRHGHQLGVKTIFFHQLVQSLVESMGEAYPELTAAKTHIENVLQREEEQFVKTLDQGLAILENEVASLGEKQIPGALLFKLYDTYGFPVDLVQDVAREKQLTLDMAGFEACMEAQKNRAREASQFKAQKALDIEESLTSEFVGYDEVESEAKVVALYRNDQAVSLLKTDEDGVVVLNQTAFYAESGGQVGDIGELYHDNFRFKVKDTQKQGQAILHIGKVMSGQLALNDAIYTRVATDKRDATARNHSATHLLHAALREVLGPQVTQKGSLVDDNRLRFDFSYPEPLTTEQLRAVEHMVNEHVRANYPVTTQIMTPEEATKAGAMALFGEKYGEQVRVLSMGAFSIELCGGTHVKATGDIGYFVITSESGIAAGVRRIEALTGQLAMDWVANQFDALDKAASLVKSNRASVPDKVAQLLESHKKLEKELAKARADLASGASQDLLEQAHEIEGVKVLAVEVKGGDAKSLRDLVDSLKQKLDKAVLLLTAVDAPKVVVIGGVTKNCTPELHAGKLVAYVAEQIGGKGGGRPDMAQGGGNNPGALAAALASVPEWVKAQLVGS